MPPRWLEVARRSARQEWLAVKLHLLDAAQRLATCLVVREAIFGQTNGNLVCLGFLHLASDLNAGGNIETMLKAYSYALAYLPSSDGEAEKLWPHFEEFWSKLRSGPEFVEDMRNDFANRV